MNSRFSSLLKPIRDLAQNWDVDIASNLNDYLQELVNINVEFEDGETNLNFADAAMLVQGSACIYSKKVEYLFSKLQDVQAMLTNRKDPKAKSSVDKDGNDVDAAEFDKTEKEEFLSLDDIPASRKLYMKEDFDKREEFHFMPEFPLSLLPYEEGERGDNPLLSKKGEVLASLTDFHLNTSYVHTSGTLLINRSFINLAGDMLNHQRDATPDGDCEEPALVTVDDNRGEPADLPPIMEEMDADDDDGGGGMPPMDFSAHVEEFREELRRSERERRPVMAPVPTQASVPADPWAMLDQFEVIAFKPPPPRKGSLHKVCAGLEQQSKKRKRMKSRATGQLESLGNFIDHALYSNKEKYPRQKFKCPTYPEMDTLFWTEFKRRQALDDEMKKKRRQEYAAVLVDPDDEEEEELEEPEEFDAPGDPGLLDDLEPLVDDNLFDALNMDDPDSLSDKLERNFEEESFEELCLKKVEAYLARVKTYTLSTELSKRVEEWESKVLPRLEEEEARAPFDINHYGTSVLDNIECGSSVLFWDLVRGKPVIEVCRTFLASLMLANTNNVEIEDSGSLEMDTFRLHLLTTRRHFEELQEFQAPSLTSQTARS